MCYSFLLKKLEMMIRTTPMVIPGIDKEEKTIGPSEITPIVSLNITPNINNRNPTQKITFPSIVCFFNIITIPLEFKVHQ
jgi:hypothetical protein